MYKYFFVGFFFIEDPMESLRGPFQGGVTLNELLIPKKDMDGLITYTLISISTYEVSYSIMGPSGPLNGP